ncbi:MAG TPA: MerR family transcriptional regulator, partial [Ignavibacteria bacterium]|nr:MerR family transcriptional regulator [Ignavibacteria bacterium]
KQSNVSMKEKFSMKKLYYSISEVSKITELEQYVLRYWETEFEQLKPAKNLAGNRIYTNKDIKLILYIKRLLRDEKYTIEGAKKLLKTYNFKEEQQDEQKPAEKRKFSPQYYHKEHKPSKELSLFNSDSKADENQEPGKTEIKRDLKELRNFLSELLEDID